jgi:hypothetical protein
MPGLGQAQAGTVFGHGRKKNSCLCFRKEAGQLFFTWKYLINSAPAALQPGVLQPSLPDQTLRPGVLQLLLPDQTLRRQFCSVSA